MKKQCLRFVIYLLGLMSLAMALSLSAQLDLGVSPLFSVTFTLHVLAGLSLGDAALVVYFIYIVVQIAIHCFLKQYRRIPVDLLQLPFGLLFSRFLNIFEAMLPNFGTDFAGSVFGTIPMRMLLFLPAIIMNGSGTALSLMMRIVPNPGDGFVQALADLTGKPLGFVKNCADILSVCFSCIMGMLFAGRILGIGIGTVMGMIGNGRMIALVNRFVKPKLVRLVGLSEN